MRSLGKFYPGLKISYNLLMGLGVSDFLSVGHIFAFLSSHNTFSSWPRILKCQPRQVSDLTFATPISVFPIIILPRPWKLKLYRSWKYLKKSSAGSFSWPKGRKSLSLNNWGLVNRRDNSVAITLTVQCNLCLVLLLCRLIIPQEEQ